MNWGDIGNTTFARKLFISGKNRMKKILGTIPNSNTSNSIIMVIEIISKSTRSVTVL